MYCKQTLFFIALPQSCLTVCVCRCVFSLSDVSDWKNFAVAHSFSRPSVYNVLPLSLRGRSGDVTVSACLDWQLVFLKYLIRRPCDTIIIICCTQVNICTIFLYDGHGSRFIYISPTTNVWHLALPHDSCTSLGVRSPLHCNVTGSSCPLTETSFYCACVHKTGGSGTNNTPAPSSICDVTTPGSLAVLALPTDLPRVNKIKEACWIYPQHHLCSPLNFFFKLKNKKQTLPRDVYFFRFIRKKKSEYMFPWQGVYLRFRGQCIVHWFSHFKDFVIEVTGSAGLSKTVHNPDSSLCDFLFCL